MRYFKPLMLIALSISINYSYSNNTLSVNPNVQIGNIYSETTQTSHYTPCIKGEIVRNNTALGNTSNSKSHLSNTITYTTEAQTYLYTESFKSKEIDTQCLSSLVSNNTFSEIKDKAHYISGLTYGVSLKQHVILDFPNKDIMDHIWENSLLVESFYNSLDDELKTQKVSVFINYEIINGAASLLEENGLLQDRVFTCELKDYQLCDNFAQLSKDLIISLKVLPNDFEYSTPVAITIQDLSVYLPDELMTDHSNNRYFELTHFIKNINNSINVIKSNLEDLKFQSLDEVKKQYNDLDNLNTLKVKVVTFQKHYDNSINNEEMISEFHDEYFELLQGASL